MEVMLFVLIAAVNLISNGKGIVIFLFKIFNFTLLLKIKMC